MNERALRQNRFQRLRPWLAFLAIALLFAIFEWGVEAAGRQSEARQIRDEDIGNEIRWRMQPYAHWSELPALEKEFNGGRALPRQAIINNMGSAERVVVDVSRLGAAYAGWHVRFDYAGPGNRYNEISVISPPPQAHLFNWLATPRSHEAAYRARQFLLVVCAATWLGAMVILIVAGPWRRRLAQVAIAAALLAALAWAADSRRPELWSLPPLTWIALASGGGLLLGIVAAVIPSRIRVVRLGRCNSCGYDLTGNISGSCPECGQKTPVERRRERDLELAPFAQAIEQVAAVPDAEDIAPEFDGESGFASGPA